VKSSCRAGSRNSVSPERQSGAAELARNGEGQHRRFGNIKADGKVEHAEIHIAGSGDADLGEVKSQRSKSISPAAAIPISRPARSGNPCRQRRRQPARQSQALNTHIAGSGRIHNLIPGLGHGGANLITSPSLVL
jgi:hypothetical protein